MFADRSHLTASRRGFLRVISWSFVAEAGGQITTVLVGVLLAALVGPEAYGIVAMAMVYVLLVELVQRQGIVSAIIQRRQMTDAHMSSAFWLVLVTSVTMTALSAALAGWWADLNQVPLLKPVIIALSLLLPIKALITVQEALLRRRLDFKKVALRSTLSVFIGGIAGVVTAVVEPSVWAFVVQQFVATAVAVVCLWAATRWRPQLRFSASAARDLLGFSAGSFFASLGVFVNNRADTLLIGLFFSPVAVGVYAIGARVVDAFVGFALRPMQSVALPELSPFQDDHPRLRQRLRRLGRMTAAIGLVPLAVFVAAADPLGRLLGSEWTPAILPMQLLAAVAAVRLMTGLMGPVLQALGRPHLHAVVTWFLAAISTAVTVGGALLLQSAPAAEQAAGLAGVRLLFVGVVGMATYLVLLRLVLNLKISDALGPFLPWLFAGLSGAAAGLFVGRSYVGGLDPAGHLVLVTVVVVATATVVVVAVEPVVRHRAARLGHDLRLFSSARAGRHRRRPANTNEQLTSGKVKTNAPSL